MSEKHLTEEDKIEGSSAEQVQNKTHDDALSALRDAVVTDPIKTTFDERKTSQVSERPHVTPQIVEPDSIEAKSAITTKNVTAKKASQETIQSKATV